MLLWASNGATYDILNFILSKKTLTSPPFMAFLPSYILLLAALWRAILLYILLYFLPPFIFPHIFSHILPNFEIFWRVKVSCVSRLTTEVCRSYPKLTEMFINNFFLIFKQEIPIEFVLLMSSLFYLVYISISDSFTFYYRRIYLLKLTRFLKLTDWFIELTMYKQKARN